MRTLDVQAIIDNARFTPFHWTVMAWCGLLLIFDGYDLFIYGVVLPVIMKEWGLTPLQAGALGSYALFGMMFGALAFGSLADRIGRKKGIALCFALFSGATILNGFASSPGEFGIYRFIAGLGCGGLMPNAVALMNEYAPKRLRSTLVAIMFSGYSLGGMLSAGVGIYLLPRFGWESMFFAAALPLLLLPVILYYLPESIGFLVRQGRVKDARALLKRVDPDCNVQTDDVLQVSERKAKGASVAALFREGLAVRTLALWLAFFCCLLMVYALSSWLPKLMANAGYSLGSSLSFLLALNFGGMAGAIFGGWLGTATTGQGQGGVLLGCGLVHQSSGREQPNAGALWADLHRRRHHHRHADPAVCRRRPALRPVGALHGAGLGVGYRPQWRHCRPAAGGALMGINLPLQLNFIAFAIPGAIAALAMAVHLASGRRHGLTAPAQA